MTKYPENLTAHESVWVYRLRQRIVLERIILDVGNSRERRRAKQFLDSMEQANPELFEDMDLSVPLLFEELEPSTPELFDEREYSHATGRKTALKLPQDILWEEKIIRRTVREFRDLFHPCEDHFKNAMKGLKYLLSLHPDLFARARAQAIEQRNQILNFDIHCKCGCTANENLAPEDSFRVASQGRFRNVSRRIASACQVLEGNHNDEHDDSLFFLDRVREIAPEMID